MPRSGSTLLENIISVKNNVIDMGEVSYLEQSLNEISDIKDIFKKYISKIKDNKNNYILQIRICLIFYIVLLFITIFLLQKLFIV